MRGPLNTTAQLILLFILALMTGCGGPQGNTNALLTATPTPTPEPPQVDCTKSPTDQELLDGIYTMLAFKHPDAVKQEWQFNVTARAATKQVTITGWSNLRGPIIEDTQYAAKNCAVDYTNFKYDRSELDPRFRVGCPSGYAPCGDICVPVGDPCKITSELHAAAGSAPVCVQATPTATPGKPPKR